MTAHSTFGEHGVSDRFLIIRFSDYISSVLFKCFHHFVILGLRQDDGLFAGADDAVVKDSSGYDLRRRSLDIRVGINNALHV